jgi:hypothetical protein
MSRDVAIELLVRRTGLNRFYARRVVQRLERGEISTREAAELLMSGWRMPPRSAGRDALRTKEKGHPEVAQ